MVVISFYTENWLYPQCAEILKADCDRYGISHDICPVKSTGEWIDNTRLKPQFILEKLLKYNEVVWVDVDSHFLQKPNLFKKSLGADLGLIEHTTMPRHWHVGIMAFNSNEKTIQLVSRWVEECSKGGTDEAAFERAWNEYGNGFKVKKFPIEYHALPISNKYPEDSIIAMGLSKDESKMNMKKRNRELREKDKEATPSVVM